MRECFYLTPQSYGSHYIWGRIKLGKCENIHHMESCVCSPLIEELFAMEPDG